MNQNDSRMSENLDFVWGKEFVDYVIKQHILLEETKVKQCSFIGLNAPRGIGKQKLIENLGIRLDRNVIVASYPDFEKNWNVYLECNKKKDNSKHLLCYIEETEINAGKYSNKLTTTIDEIKDVIKNADEHMNGSIFIFGSTGTMGTNSPHNVEFKIFQYGRLSMEEKIQVAGKIVIECKNKYNLHEVELPENSIKELIKYYTKEPGVSYLSVLIDELYASMYMKKRNGELREKVTITNQGLCKLIGNGCYVFDELGIENVQVFGMAYTDWGGVLLPILMEKNKGTGNFTIMGNIGPIMQDSVSVTFQYLKSNYKILGISKREIDKFDYTISIDDLALYKDGASAGLAFFAMFLCTMKKIKLNKRIALSGEVSLDGRILRIGGVKEKLCTAWEHGITDFILPTQSFTEYQMLSESMKKQLDIIFIDHVEELNRLLCNYQNHL